MSYMSSGPSSSTSPVSSRSIRRRFRANLWAPRLEVTSWPFDELARERLAQFRQERTRDLDVVFCGDDLDLRGGHLCGIDFRRGWFNGCVLDKVRILAANLTDASLCGASLAQADLSGCVLSGADLSYCRGRWAVLAWARLMRAEIYDADLREADLIGAELDDAVLGGSDLRGARLQDVKFARTSLGRARLADSVLIGARGSVRGPVDVSKTDEPQVIDGEELLDFLRDQGAAHVTLAHPAS